MDWGVYKGDHLICYLFDVLKEKEEEEKEEEKEEEEEEEWRERVL